MPILILLILAQFQNNMLTWHFPEKYLKKSTDVFAAFSSAIDQKLCETNESLKSCDKFCLEAWEYADFDKEFVYCKEVLNTLHADLSKYYISEYQ